MRPLLQPHTHTDFNPIEVPRVAPLGPSAHEMARTPDHEASWDVPLELLLACSSSKLKAYVLQRCEDGGVPNRTCRVFRRGDRLFGVVDMVGLNKWILLPLDVWVMPAVEAVKAA